MNDGTLEGALRRLPPGTTLQDAQTMIAKAIYEGTVKSGMRVARYNRHLDAADNMLERRVRLAYAVLGTSVTVFGLWGARLYFSIGIVDPSRLLMPFIGLALCYIALQIENKSHYRRNGEFLLHAVDMEVEDTSSSVEGPGHIAAKQHIEGSGFSSVGAAVAITALVWVMTCFFEIARL